MTFEQLTSNEKYKLDKIKSQLGFKDDLTFLKYCIEDNYFEESKAFITGISTVKASYKTWCQQIGLNMPVILKSKDFSDLMRYEKMRGGSAIIIAAGPSVWRDDLKQLKQLANSNYKGVIIACDRMLIPCLEKNVIPQYVVSIDSSEKVAEWFTHPLVEKYSVNVKLLAATSIHPKVLEVFKGEKYFFTPLIPEKMLSNASNTLNWITGKSVLFTGGCSGNAAWFICRNFGKNPICYIGQDLSYPWGTLLYETDKFQAYVENLGGKVNYKEGKVESITFPQPTDEYLKKLYGCYRRGVHPYFKTEFLTDYCFDSLLESLVSHIQADKVRNKENAPKTVNCTEGGSLWEGVECMWFKDFLSMICG